jgi:hypothetical protein
LLLSELEHRAEIARHEPCRGAICARLRQTGPRIDTDQLAGLQTLMKRYVVRPEFWSRLSDRPPLTVSRIQTCLEACTDPAERSTSRRKDPTHPSLESSPADTRLAQYAGIVTQQPEAPHVLYHCDGHPKVPWHALQ